jgi:Mn-containing catalase
MVGYLLVRGGVHIVAYAKALEKLTGVDVGKLLPIPDISNKKFPEARAHEDRGLHTKLYQFSPQDYTLTILHAFGLTDINKIGDLGTLPGNLPGVLG